VALVNHPPCPGVALPALFAVGGQETAAFQQQTADMHATWLHAGNRSRHQVVDGADHFTLLRCLQRPGPLLQGILDIIQNA
jgi:arylformamidase